ncbi:hypothetical protein SZ55_0319 [Pseudomonas sp. FeS53a]|nr:hypothetical protein SZ55_0319 [Pseudomonas sp. FeS53a]
MDDSHSGLPKRMEGWRLPSLTAPRIKSNTGLPSSPVNVPSPVGK